MRLLHKMEKLHNTENNNKIKSLQMIALIRG